jgi:hypothetical protein
MKEDRGEKIKMVALRTLGHPLGIQERQFSESESEPGTPPAAPTSKTHATTIPERFDVAISFAGPQRSLALALAEILRAAGHSVFYDDFSPSSFGVRISRSFSTRSFAREHAIA